MKDGPLNHRIEVLDDVRGWRGIGFRLLAVKLARLEASKAFFPVNNSYRTKPSAYRSL
jgi:hypothetical protein